MEIQKQIGERNEEEPDEPRMAFRVGINVGDVVEADDLLYGGGVNIAARVETLATDDAMLLSPVRRVSVTWKTR